MRAIWANWQSSARLWYVKWPLIAIAAVVIVAAVASSMSSAAPATTTASPVAVSRDQMGDRWPLTVDSGVLGCERSAAFIDVQGKLYGLNGMATAARGYLDLAPIWAPAVDAHGPIPGQHKSIAPLVDAALKICDQAK